MSRPQRVHRVFLMASGMMLIGQGPVVDRSPGWRGQGPVVNRSPRMMMRRRPGIPSLIRSTAAPGWAVESTPCLDLELDLPDEDEGRVRSPLSWHLGE